MPASASASTSQQRQQQSIDNAFKVYKDRLQTDFRDFHAMCSQFDFERKRREGEMA